MKEQFNHATLSLETRQRDSMQEMRNQQKEFMDYMKSLNQQMTDERRKYEDDHKKLVEQNTKSFENKIQSDIEFKKKEMDLLLEHQNKMNSLEIQKVTEAHKLELSRMNLQTDKTTPSEWSKIIVDTLPEITKGFREAVDAYRAVKDLDVKAVN